jgi:hypothetical protein
LEWGEIDSTWYNGYYLAYYISPEQWMKMMMMMMTMMMMVMVIMIMSVEQSLNDWQGNKNVR